MSVEVPVIDKGHLAIDADKVTFYPNESQGSTEPVEIPMSDVEHYHFERVPREKRGALVLVAAGVRHVFNIDMRDAPHAIKPLREAEKSKREKKPEEAPPAPVPNVPAPGTPEPTAPQPMAARSLSDGDGAKTDDTSK